MGCTGFNKPNEIRRLSLNFIGPSSVIGNYILILQYAHVIEPNFVNNKNFSFMLCRACAQGSHEAKNLIVGQTRFDHMYVL